MPSRLEILQRLATWPQDVKSRLIGVEPDASRRDIGGVFLIAGHPQDRRGVHRPIEELPFVGFGLGEYQRVGARRRGRRHQRALSAQLLAP